MNARTSAIVADLEAERLTPVPRASHAVAVDVDDLALVLELAHGGTDWGRVRSDAVAAYGRLENAVRRHAHPGEAA